MSETTEHPDRCMKCGVELGAGYLCDDCDEVEILDGGDA